MSPEVQWYLTKMDLLILGMYTTRVFLMDLGMYTILDWILRGFLLRRVFKRITRNEMVLGIYALAACCVQLAFVIYCVYCWAMAIPSQYNQSSWNS